MNLLHHWKKIDFIEKSTPRSLKLISPGDGMIPPPVKAGLEIV